MLVSQGKLERVRALAAPIPETYPKPFHVWQLLASDQLSIAQRSGAAFDTFAEAAIAFQPTYK